MVGIYSEIGKRIRFIRDSRNITQLELAHKVGLTRSSIANIELGRQHLTIDTLYIIAKKLEVSIGDLLPHVNWKITDIPLPEQIRRKHIKKIKKSIAEINQIVSILLDIVEESP